jgi:hypothetical protein
MNLHLFHRARTCDELGICQRTGPQCQRACQQSHPSSSAEAFPIGYEAARTCVVYQFPGAQEPAQHPAPARDDDEALLMSAGRAAGWFIAALGLLALVGWLWTHHSEDIASLLWAVAALYG